MKHAIRLVLDGILCGFAVLGAEALFQRALPGYGTAAEAIFVSTVTLFFMRLSAAAKRDAAERGEVISQEEVERRMAKWLGE